VPLPTLIQETYKTVCHWHPIANLIDSVKWAKLAKKMKFFSWMKNSNHEIDMAFVRHSRDRKLDLRGFEAILRDVASFRYSPRYYDADVSFICWHGSLLFHA